jgi:anti-anti-sigma factor
MKIAAGDIIVWLSRLHDKVQVDMGDVVSLQISAREARDVTILDLRGGATLDNGESELLSSQLRTLVPNRVRNLLLNLADLTQIDSSGVSIIVGTYVSLKRQGGDLKLLCPGGRVLEV